MPVRFTSPSLGGQRQSLLHAGEWQIGVAYRRLSADQWFVGTEVNEAAAPFSKPVYLEMNSMDLSATYALSNRTSLTATLPFSYGTQSRFYADGARHNVRAYGLGDISLVANHWMLDPNNHLGGNISLGLGAKLPTGGKRHEDDFFNADGTVTQRVVDQSIQLGDGGWGVVAQLQAYQLLVPRLSGYVFGSYLLSPRKTTDVPSPLPNVVLSVPDVYTARAGFAYAASKAGGVSLSLGARMDGIPLRDIIGGGDDGFRRPGYTLFLDPGLTVGRGASELTFSLPIRLHQNFKRSLVDMERNFAGGGDLANYLVFAGFTHRF